MTDVASYDILDEQHRDKDTEGWIYEVEPVYVLWQEPRGEQMLDLLDEGLKDDGCNTGTYTYNETQKQHDVLLNSSFLQLLGNEVEEC